MDMINENKIIADVIKQNEEILTNYLIELQIGLREGKLNIDGIEKMMLTALDNFKKSVVTGTNQMMSDESKKKFLLAVAKDAERLRLLQQKKVTDK
jgi:hypothetical protein